jgi:multiple sugar transport system substrate-binding protein
VTPRLAMTAGLVALCALAAGCGGDDDSGGGSSSSGDIKGKTLTVWSNEGQPDRIAALKSNLADFTKKSGVKTKIVAIPEDQLPTLMTNAAAAGKLPDVVAATSAADTLSYAKQDIFDPSAAQAVVDKLGPDTFSKKAIDLVSQDGKVAGVPSDGWGQLLIYRKDLFKQAGLGTPKTLEDIQAAAKKLNKSGMAGIVLATAPGDGFTAESFENVALAKNCQLVDDAGKVTFDSPECVDALNYYADLAKNYSVKGNQDVDSTRGTYFAGDAAMMFWSPFLLDGMAGLRADTKPSCPECKKDPAFLAKNSGLVGPLSSNGGKPTQFGNVSTFAISTSANKAAAQALVEYMMTDGYTRWLGLSPQGKYPVRLGDKSDPEKYQKAWAELESGVDKKAPLSKYYDKASIASLGDGVENFQRWGFPQGQGALIGALSGEQPIAKAVASVIGGTDAQQAAQQAQSTVEEIKAGLE